MSKAKTTGVSIRVILRNWCVKEVERRSGTRSRHILGHDITNDLGRASTAIMAFDSATMTATTRSGSLYTLQGQPGNSSLGRAAWGKWLGDHGVVSELDVTREYLQTQEQQADTTVTFTKLGRGVRLDDEQ